MTRLVVVQTHSEKNAVFDVSGATLKEIHGTHFHGKHLLTCAPHFSQHSYWAVTSGGEILLLEGKNLEPSVAYDAGLPPVPPEKATGAWGESGGGWTFACADEDWLLLYDRNSKICVLFQLVSSGAGGGRGSMGQKIVKVQEFQGVLAANLYQARFLVLLWEEKCRLAISALVGTLFGAVVGGEVSAGDFGVGRGFGRQFVRFRNVLRSGVCLICICSSRGRIRFVMSYDRSEYIVEIFLVKVSLSCTPTSSFS